MEPWQIGLLLKPLVLPLFFYAVVAPAAWLLFRLFPDGRLKVVLFRERTKEGATARDKAVMTLAVIGSYVAFFALIVVLSKG